MHSLDNMISTATNFNNISQTLSSCKLIKSKRSKRKKANTHIKCCLKQQNQFSYVCHVVFRLIVLVQTRTTVREMQKKGFNMICLFVWHFHYWTETRHRFRILFYKWMTHFCFQRYTNTLIHQYTRMLCVRTILPLMFLSFHENGQ